MNPYRLLAICVLGAASAVSTYSLSTGVVSVTAGPDIVAVPACEAELTDLMRDPGSVTFDEITSDDIPDSGWSVTGGYGARNGFGGMNKGVFVCFTSDDGTDPRVFTDESLED